MHCDCILTCPQLGFLAIWLFWVAKETCSTVLAKHQNHNLLKAALPALTNSHHVSWPINVGQDAAPQYICVNLWCLSIVTLKQDPTKGTIKTKYFAGLLGSYYRIPWPYCTIYSTEGLCLMGFQYNISEWI